eukprot:4916514-Alexandrium_andersonii.AAC.1
MRRSGNAVEDWQILRGGLLGRQQLRLVGVLVHRQLPLHLDLSLATAGWVGSLAAALAPTRGHWA